jgi:surfactin family lipopeptide synthetase C
MNVKNIEAIYPLSPVQQAMLFHTLFEPESAAYFSQLNCSIEGDLDVISFKKAWQRVMDRHSSLRTAFVWEGVEQPLQVLGERVKLTVEELDWKALDEIEQRQRLKAYLKQDMEKGFKLSKAPLMRLALIEIGENRYQFIWSHHHLLLDGWSWPLVIREALAFYDAFSKGEDLQLEPARPYASYISWLLNQNLSKAEVYWRETLRGLHAPTALAVVCRPEKLSGAEEIYKEIRATLPSRLLIELQSLAKQYQLTLNTVAQGAWALLLGCYSGVKDIIFGITSSGRPPTLQGVEKIVGVFINTLPFRAQIAARSPLASWLKQLQSQQVELRQYEFSPLTEVHGWSQIPRTLPLFESIFVFQNYPVDASLRKQNGNLKIHVAGTVENTNYPITVVASAASELMLKIVYDTRLFDKATIERVIGHLQTLLENMAADPERPVWSLPLLTRTERDQLLIEFNNTEAQFPLDKCLPELFEQQVNRSPDAIAVSDGEEALTYSEFNRQANQLAHYLRKSGVGPESMVGVCLERGPDIIIALLAVLKAGGAYVPLDPFYPKERMAYIISNARISALITRQSMMEKFPDRYPCAICVDTNRDLIDRESETGVAGRVTPENLAYVIYTSGSTGLPKGAMIEHRGMLNHLFAKIEDLKLTCDDVVAQTASQCFDISVWQFLAVLLVGGRVEIFDDESAHYPAKLLERVERIGVTILETVPALLRGAHEKQVSSGASRYRIRTLRWLLVTGEALPPDLCRQWLQTHATPPLLNAYGPTECSDDVTHFPIHEAVSDRLNTIPIGRPVANLRIYIVDRRLEPLPIGVAGELYVEGIGVGRGYFDNPSRTAEAFVANPVARQPGSRLYRTGDLARYLPDGNIEYLGRIDHQIKIRGFRIELGEIESVLCEHPAVKQAVVNVREEGNGDKKLIAYLVAEQEPGPSQTELRGFLSGKLPDYMLPSFFVSLSEFPLTSNGKIDRQALAAADLTTCAIAREYSAPRTAVEEVIAGIWAEVLNLERIGIDDNFFEVGGHSLLAIQVLSRLLEIFHIDLPLRALFDAVTVAELAERVVAREPRPGQAEKIARVVKKMEGISSEEKQKMLQAKRLERGIADESPSISIPF